MACMVNYRADGDYRLEHSALAIHITGESYRGVKARKLANKKKDS